MTQQDDDTTTRAGLWVVFTTVAALLIGLIIWVLKEAGVSRPQLPADTKTLSVGTDASTQNGHAPAAAAGAATAADQVAAAHQDHAPSVDTSPIAERTSNDQTAQAQAADNAAATSAEPAAQTQPAVVAEPSADDFVAFDNLNQGELSAVVHFASASAVLPTDTSAEIAGVVDMLKASESRRVLVAGFHDPTGNAAFNEQLARKRAFAVRDALMAQGISSDRIIMRKPEQTTGTGTLAEARRVELRLID